MNAEHNHPYILISGGSRNGVSIPVLKANMLIGRDPDADIVIDDSTVSRKRAEIARAGDEFVLLDLDSKNGSFVNEVKVGRMGQSLRDGDEIRFGPGHTALIFRDNTFTGKEVREPRVTESVILSAEQLGQEVPADEVLSGTVRFFF
jgi:pSer/pThr/pTyr-binding forkhead associated (FHA) protein